MEKETWKAGNMLYPLPAVMVSVSDGEGNDNIITVAWAGTVCTNPPMVSISVRPSRFSYDMLRKTGEFVINLTTEKLAYATDYCGVRSGRDVDKFKEMKTYAESKIAENSNPKRKEYSLRNNNCGTFAADVLKQDPSVKDKAPVIIVSRPNSIVKEYQNSFKSLNYDPKKRQVKIE